MNTPPVGSCWADPSGVVWSYRPRRPSDPMPWRRLFRDSGSHPAVQQRAAGRDLGPLTEIRVRT